MDRATPSLKLTATKTADGEELDGALYSPAQTSSVHLPAILMVHGLTWNFYRGPSRWLPPLLAAEGFPCLSINMRDHDEKESRDFELSHHDIRAGVDLLTREAAGREVIVLAHGYGCNKVLCYPAWSQDVRLGRMVLTTLGAVKSYRPVIWETVLRNASAVRGRLLVVQGATDHLIEARERAGELTAAAPESRVDTVLLEGADHYFNNRHQELADCIIGWIRETAR
jgi:pimeloyl-ACP methyl ester carboxylesterase